MEKLAICGYYDKWFHITQFENETTIIPEVKRIDLNTEDFTINWNASYNLFFNPKVKLTRVYFENNIQKTQVIDSIVNGINTVHSSSPITFNTIR